MQLVITEKPSVAQSVAHVIGAKRAKRRVYGGERIYCFMVHRTSCGACEAGSLF